MDLGSEPNFQGLLFPASLDFKSIVSKDTPGSHRGFPSVQQRWESAHQFGALFTNTLFYHFCMIFQIFSIGVNFVEITNLMFKANHTADMLHEVKNYPFFFDSAHFADYIFYVKKCEITVCAYLIYVRVMIKYF
jgi:hypothetical protein